MQTANPVQNVAVIGAGAAGLACAYLASKSEKHDVTVFEATEHAGGHAWTVEVSPGTAASRQHACILCCKCGAAFFTNCINGDCRLMERLLILDSWCTMSTHIPT